MTPEQVADARRKMPQRRLLSVSVMLEILTSSDSDAEALQVPCYSPDRIPHASAHYLYTMPQDLALNREFVTV